ncbi:MAG: glycosyltransferase [Aeromicrobium sp.]|nr:glycosyltransferase [Burkholderiales bacterium]
MIFSECERKVRELQRDALRGKKILILISGHLAMQPRAIKEAKLLREAGAHVIIRGTWWSPTMADEDLTLAREMAVDFAPVVDMRRGQIGAIRVRLRQRLARECFTRLGWVSPLAFGLGAHEFLREARLLNADLTIVCSEPGLWVGKKLIDEGRRVGVDFLDWFSQDLLPADRNARPVVAMQTLERYLLERAACCLTTSKVLSEALAQDAATTRRPVVVPNCFPAFVRQTVLRVARDSETAGVVCFHWFSQTIGPGRGLESLAKALSLLRGDWRLTLRGNLSGYQTWFANAFPASVRGRINLLAPVLNADLLAHTMANDVGLALEVPYCDNKNLTASNKIFEYLRAGLAVIATRTRGQEEVMQACPNAGMLVEPDDPVSLGHAMQMMLDDADYRESCRRFSLEAGGSVWSWETHAPKLLNAIAGAIESPLQ